MRGRSKVDAQRFREEIKRDRRVSNSVAWEKSRQKKYRRAVVMSLMSRMGRRIV